VLLWRFNFAGNCKTHLRLHEEPDICLIWNFSADFTEVPSIKIHENPFSGSRADTCRRAEKRTDMMKVTGAFRDSANKFKKELQL
jgi:hypothetical protein